MKACRYPCPHPGCSLSYASKYNVRRHLKVSHPDYHPFQCPTCSKVLSSKQNYKQHQHIHTGAKPFLCTAPGCGMQFRQGSQLSIHKKTHYTLPIVEISIVKVRAMQLTDMLAGTSAISVSDFSPAPASHSHPPIVCVLPDIVQKSAIHISPLALQKFDF